MMKTFLDRFDENYNHPVILIGFICLKPKTAGSALVKKYNFIENCESILNKLKHLWLFIVMLFYVLKYAIFP